MAICRVRNVLRSPAPDPKRKALTPMAHGIPESDWKLFRQLHPLARDRYCQRILQEIERLAAGRKKNSHQRYLEIYKLVEKRDREIGRAFDGLRRSTALSQLALIYSYGVITEEEFMRFSLESRERISVLSTLVA